MGRIYSIHFVFLMLYILFSCGQREGKTQFPEENLVINKLIKDYLLFNGYNYTCSVFLKGL